MLYDTLGEEAYKYIISSTGLTTISMSRDLVEKACRMKIGDKEK